MTTTSSQKVLADVVSGEACARKNDKHTLAKYPGSFVCPRGYQLRRREAGRNKKIPTDIELFPPSIHPSIHLSIYPSIHTSIHPSIQYIISVHLSTGASLFIFGFQSTLHCVPPHPPSETNGMRTDPFLYPTLPYQCLPYIFIIINTSF